MNTSTFKHLAQNTQARQALTWAAQNPDEALRLIGEIGHNYHRDIDARNAENLGALIDRDPKAKDIFDRAIDRMSWHDKKAELRSMPLSRGRYAAADLARDISIFQGTREAQDRQRNAWRGTLAALGGRSFLDQIGAKQFESHNAEIRFSVPRGFTKGGIDNVRIDMDPAGNFIIDFRSGPGLVETRRDVTPERLPLTFAAVTGLK